MYINAVRLLRGRAQPSGRALKLEEIRELFVMCDAALLSVILDCDLRRSELSPETRH